MTEPILVLGLGNELFTDEGVGVAVGRQVGELDLPGVEVIDGGTLGLALLPTIEGRRGLLVLDAVDTAAGRPGEVIVYQGDQLWREARLLYSAHQLGITEVLAAADLVGTTPELIAAVCMVPASLETGYGLSPEASEGLSTMIDRVLEILVSWGVKEPANA